MEKQRKLTRNNAWKRFVVGVLSLALLMSIMPLKAEARVVDFLQVGDLSVDLYGIEDNNYTYGTKDAIKERNQSTLPDDGWSWAFQVNATKKQYKLILNNYSYTDEDGNKGFIGLEYPFSGRECEIVLKGMSTIQTTGMYGLKFEEESVTFSGDGSLQVYNEGIDIGEDFYGIKAQKLTINSGNLEVSVDNPVGYGLSGEEGVTINGGTVKAEAYKCGIVTDISSGFIAINGGKIIAKCNNRKLSMNNAKYGRRSGPALNVAPTFFGNLTAQASTSNDGSNLVPYVAADNSSYMYFIFDHVCANLLTKHARVEPSCITDGTEEYYECTCGRLYSDLLATTQITAPTTIPASGHSFSTIWDYNATYHWYPATCGHSTEVKAKATHVFGDDTICDICGYNSAPPVPGVIDVDSPATNSYSGKVTDETDVINKVVTDEEKAILSDGMNIKVSLKVEDISNTISDSDKALIDKILGEKEKALYLDVSLFKKVGNNPEQKITKTNGKIKVSIALPPALLNEDTNVARTYKIIRIHEGVVTILDATYDPATGLLTFETDEFSTYAVVYSSDKAQGDQKDDVPKTGDEGVTYTWLIIVTASVIGLALTLGLYLKRYRTRVNKE